jgi:hypothetical protein
MLAEILAGQATSANRDLGRRRLPAHASIAMACGKWHLVDSTQDAASRDLSCTTHKSVWYNNQHKIRSPCRTFRPTDKERRPYKAHVDTSDVACGSEGLDCCFVHREAGMWVCLRTLKRHHRPDGALSFRCCLRISSSPIHSKTWG